MALAAALALAGCGRKGPLELPPGAPQAETPAASNAQQARVLGPIADPGLIQPPTNAPPQRPASVKLKEETAAPPPAINGPNVNGGKAFVLDPLL